MTLHETLGCGCYCRDKVLIKPCPFHRLSPRLQELEEEVERLNTKFNRLMGKLVVWEQLLAAERHRDVRSMIRAALNMEGLLGQRREGE